MRKAIKTECDYPTKAIIGTTGDPSAGIFPATVVIDFNGVDVTDGGEMREEIRQDLAQCFSQIMDEGCGVMWEDECPDCGKIGDHECPFDTEENPDAEKQEEG